LVIRIVFQRFEKFELNLRGRSHRLQRHLLAFTLLA
jgi:hypothetical protein